jgi:hypothetical protein
MEHLIQDKVETFWRAIQTQTDRRGQVCPAPFHSPLIHTKLLPLDCRNIFNERTQKVMVSIISRRRRHPLGTMVRPPILSPLSPPLFTQIQDYQHRASSTSNGPRYPHPRFSSHPKNSLSFRLTDRQIFYTNLTTTLTKSIQTMLTHTSSERGRTAVPPITQSTGISPFPFKITVKVSGEGL